MTVAVVIVAIVVSIDQLTKFFISKLISSTGSLPILKNVFYLTLVHNTGTAFGLFKNQTYFFIIISLVIILVIFLLIKKTKGNLILKIALSLIIGGAFSNLIDRIRLGYVIDFLDFRIWPVFNIADSCITVGAFLLAWRLIVKGKNPLRTPGVRRENTKH